MAFVYSKAFEAEVIATIFDELDAPIVALADGRVVFPDSDLIKDAHPDAGILCAVAHPSGLGIITGGDDGRVVWTTTDTDPLELAHHQGLWIDLLAATDKGQILAYGSGKKVFVKTLGKADAPHNFVHEHSVSGLCFDPSGKKLYCATYGGVDVWFSRIASQKPQRLKWAGSHTAVAASPDGRFLMTAMQDNALHGWRLSDSKDMRMGGYPAKIKSLEFFAKGKLLATSGASGAVVWPFLRPTGPMGEQASEINADPAALVVKVAGAPEHPLLAAGLDDGRVWLADLASEGVEWVKREKGSPITALCLNSTADRLLIGDEDGFVYIFEAE